jgi:hypothetical protein
MPSGASRFVNSRTRYRARGPFAGLANGILRAVEGTTGTPIFPVSLQLGAGRYAVDLGVNLYGPALCTAGYLLGAAYRAASTPSAAR